MTDPVESVERWLANEGYPLEYEVARSPTAVGRPDNQAMSWTRRLVAGLVVVVALTGCAGGPVQGEATSGATPTQESDCGPPPSIGDYDRAAFEHALGVHLVTEVESNGWLSHEYVVEGNFHFEFQVDPDVDPTAIVFASAHIDDARVLLTEQEQAMEDAWFALVGAAQPEAADWMRDEMRLYVPLTGGGSWSTQWLEASDGTCVRVMAGTFMWWYPDQPDHWVFWEITTDWPTL